MKVLPFLTAAIVCVVLYFLVIDRSTLFSFAGADAGNLSETSDSAPMDAPEVEVSDDGMMAVRVVTYTAQPLASGIQLTGETLADRQVDVRAETSAIVEEVFFSRGDKVETNDVICKLDVGTRQAAYAEAQARLDQAMRSTPEASAAITEAQARLAEAEITLNTTRELRRNGYASASQLASAQSAWDAASANLERARSQNVTAAASIQGAQAAVDSAEQELDRLEIRAPFSGVIDDNPAEIGTLMQPGGLCATVLKLDPIRIVGFVNEMDVARIAVGARAQATLITGDEVQGEVAYVSRAADGTTRTFRVDILVENADGAIRAGQSVRIVIEAQGEMAHLVPQSSLTLDDEGALGVRTIGEGNIVAFQPVSVIRDEVDGVWVAGLPETVDVIVLGQNFVIEGVEVTPVYQEQYP